MLCSFVSLYISDRLPHGNDGVILFGFSVSVVKIPIFQFIVSVSVFGYFSDSVLVSVN